MQLTTRAEQESGGCVVFEALNFFQLNERVLYLPVHAGAYYFALSLRTFVIEHTNGWTVRSGIGTGQRFGCSAKFWCYSVAAE